MNLLDDILSAGKMFSLLVSTIVRSTHPFMIILIHPTIFTHSRIGCYYWTIILTLPNHFITLLLLIVLSMHSSRRSCLTLLTHAQPAINQSFYL